MQQSLIDRRDLFSGLLSSLRPDSVLRATDAADSMVVESIPDEVQPRPTNLALRPYQLYGARWLKWKQRGLLGDQVGLGKTIQALAAAERPVLVVVRLNLVGQWRDAILAEFPNDTVECARGSLTARTVALQRRAQWTIVNHHMFLSRWIKTGTMVKHFDRKLWQTVETPKRISVPQFDWEQYEYGTIIVDESHVFRGKDSTLSTNLLALARRTPRVYMLTGTAIVKDNDDLYMQLKIVAPTKFGSYHEFLRRYCEVSKDGYGMKVTANRAPAMLRRQLRDYMLERTYKEVGLQLPETNKEVIKIDLSEADMAIYKKARNAAILQLRDQPAVSLFSAGQVMQALRRVTSYSESKIEAAIELIQEFRQRDEGVLVFTYYREAAERLAKLLGVPCITGAEKPEDRVKIAKSNPCVVATIASLSEGVDLTHMRAVVFYEQTWEPGNMHQAIGRIRRWSPQSAGEPEPVFIYYIQARNTIDTRIFDVEGTRAKNIVEILKTELA